MLLPPEKRLKFFVYVVESPSAVDLYHDRCEASPLRSLLSLSGVLCVPRRAISREAFTAALTIGWDEARRTYPGLLPVLHISAHGSPDGISLSTGDVLTWAELRGLLVPLNEALGQDLLVCMSTCHGYSGTRMAMELADPKHPFFALVGNGGKPTWSDTAAAFVAFYHLLAKGHSLKDAVARMNQAAGDDLFLIQTAEEVRRNFQQFLKAEAATLSAANTSEPSVPDPALALPAPHVEGTTKEIVLAAA